MERALTEQGALTKGREEACLGSSQTQPLQMFSLGVVTVMPNLILVTECAPVFEMQLAINRISWFRFVQQFTLMKSAGL